MGRKLTAIKSNERSKPKGIYKTAVVRSHKKRVPKVLRRDSGTSAKREYFGIQQTVEKKSIIDSFRKLFDVREIRK